MVDADPCGTYDESLVKLGLLVLETTGIVDGQINH